MFSLSEHLLGLLGDPRAFDLCLLERPTGVPYQLAREEEAVSAFVEVAAELAPRLGASEIGPRLVAFLCSCFFVTENSVVKHPLVSILLRREVIGCRRGIFCEASDCDVGDEEQHF